MKNKNELQKKRPYQKPAVIYAKKIEVIAGVCDTARAPFPPCRKAATGCTRIID